MSAQSPVAVDVSDHTVDQSESWFAVVDRADARSFRDVLPELHVLFAGYRDLCVVLVPAQSPPGETVLKGPPVRSFALSHTLAARMRRRTGGRFPHSAHAVLCDILDDNDSDIRLAVIDGTPIQSPLRTALAPAQWIVPHRGPLAQLRRCLRAIRGAAGPRDAVTVCIDDHVDRQVRRLPSVFPECRFFTLTVTPSGPYVCRNLLASLRLGDLLIFQDSDDLPTVHRRIVLEHRIGMNDRPDVVGSHEFRVDRLAGTSSARRFPLDVNEALQRRVGFPQLHPATMARTSAFLDAGGFSTCRIFGSDTEFLLRNFFSLRLRNVDALAYTRVIRPHSLTTSVTTGDTSPRRIALEAAWKEAFRQALAAGYVASDSALAVRHRRDLSSIRLVPLS